MPEGLQSWTSLQHVSGKRSGGTVSEGVLFSISLALSPSNLGWVVILISFFTPDFADAG